MVKLNVAVVGCSINGGYLSYKLSQKGVNVTVFERKKRIGGKACSGLISERIWRHVPKKTSLVENFIIGARIHFPRKTITLRFKPKMQAIDRHRLDNYVYKLSEKAGSRVVLGTAVNNIVYHSGNKPLINAGGKTHEFDYIIGCDSALSIVRRKFSRSVPSYRSGMYCYVKGKYRDSFVEAWPLKNGFSWKIPRGDSAEFGVIDSPDRAKKEFGKLGKRFRIKGEIHSAVIPEGLALTGNPRITLCGDAAGLTKPWSGGGIIWGMVAADILVEEFPNLRRYEKRLKLRFGTKLRTAGLMTRFVNRFGSAFSKVLPKNIDYDADWGFGI